MNPKRPLIFYVEDEPLIRLVVAEELSAHGFDVIEAGSVPEAHAQLTNRHTALSGAIVDIALHEMDGSCLIDELRAEQPNLPIVIASGYPVDGLRERLARIPHLSFVEKPPFKGAVIGALAQLGTAEFLRAKHGPEASRCR